MENDRPILKGDRLHAFSIELRSRESLRNLRIGRSQGRDEVFIEGFLGELSEIRLVEQSMLEIVGRNGILRLDISWTKLNHLVSEKAKEEKQVSSEGSPEAESLSTRS